MNKMAFDHIQYAKKTERTKGKKLFPPDLSTRFKENVCKLTLEPDLKHKFLHACGVRSQFRVCPQPCFGFPHLLLKNKLLCLPIENY